jgi:hypothetical protein
VRFMHECHGKQRIFPMILREYSEGSTDDKPQVAARK